MKNAKKHFGKRALAIVLAFMIVLSVAPMNSFVSAAEEDENNVTTSVFTVIVTDGTNPIEGAEVNLKNEGTFIDDTALTNSEGKAEFASIAALESTYEGEPSEFICDYTVTADGYELASGTFCPADEGGWAGEKTIALAKVDVPIADEDFEIVPYIGTYDKAEHNAVTVTANGFDVEYKLGDGEFNAGVPVIKNAGDYAIVVKLSKSGYVTREVPVTAKIEKAERVFAFTEAAPANLVYQNGLYIENEASSTDEPGKVTYAVTEGTGIATIDADSGKLVFASIGTVEVTATMEESDNYKASEAKYKITVDPTERDFQFETTDMGETVYDPSNLIIENYIVNKENVGDVVYSIESQKRDGVDVDDVATIDAVSGKVTINAAGTIVVKATVSAGGNYKGAESKYTLTIKRATQDIVFEKPNVSGLAYKDTTKNLLSGGLSSGDITYEVVNQISSTSEPNVVTVADDGIVTAVGIGSAVIKATKAGDNRYEPDDATFNVTTVKAEQKNFTLGEDKVVYYGTKEETFVATGNETTEDVVYSCEFPADVTPFATVDEKTGKITFSDKKTGSFTLKATNPGNDFYEEAEDTCIVKIEEKDFNVKRSVQATEGENGWYTTDYVIIPAEGYVIGYSNSIADDTEWLDKIVVSKEGKTDAFGYYLKEVATGYIGKALINPDVNIDKVDPTINIEYSKENKSFLSKLFFKDKVTVTLSSVDATSGIEYFEYSLNGGEVQAVDTVSYDADNGVYFYEFDIPAQFNGKVTANATDFSGRKAKGELFNPDTNTELVVDNIAPNVTISFNNVLSDGDIYYAPRTATIKVVEKNFYADDIDVTLKRKLGYQWSFKDVDLDLDFKPVDGEADTYEASFTCDDDADYIIDAAYTDKSGNVYEYPDDIRFTIDTTESVVGATFDDGNTSNYYNTNRRVKIEVNERNFKTKNIHLNVTGKSTSAEGKEQTVALADYQQMLRNATWTKEGDINVAYIEFTDEARYSFELYYKDTIGKSNVIKDDFVIDKTKPSDLKIEYSEEKNFLEKLFFGDTVDVTISAFDSVSGLEKFVYSYDVSEGVSSVNKGEKDVTVTADKIVDGKYTFTIPAHFHGLVSFEAYDKAANASDVKNSDKVIVVDNVAPGVDVVYDNNSFENGKYYKADRNATIAITEANFYASDIEVFVNGIKETLTFNADATTEDKYVAERLFDVDGDYELKINYTDRSGNNKNYSSGQFVVDKTAPEISIAYDNNTVLNGKYFNANRTATITVTEHNFDPKDFDFEITGEITGKNGKINEVVDATKYSDFIADIKNWTAKGNDVYEIELPTFDVDARYTIAMSYTDLAGNESNAINEYFVIDKSPSIDLEISYKEPSLIEKILFSKDEVEVTLKAYDAVSGVKEFDFDFPVEEGASDINVGGKDHKDFAEGVYSAECSFKILAQYRGLVSFTATDYSTNDSDTKYGENVVVVDNIAPGMTASFDNLDVQNDKYYKKDRFATVTVNEANFFAKDVELIVYRQLNNETKFTRLTDTYTFTPVDGQKDTYSAVIPFTDDADYKFDIKYADRSGNVFDSYDDVEFVVDKIAPKVKLSYKDEESVTPKNENNYNVNRTPVITVTEHNFDPSNFEFEITGVITNKDGVEETVFTQADGYLSYIRNEANWTHKGNDVHEIVMPELTVDARYTIDRIAYTDLAGNDSNVLSDKFVIDKNVPTDLEIIYEDTTWFDNLLEAVSFGFYKEKATVTLKAVDNISSLDYFTYSYKVGHGATPVNQGKDNQVVTPDADGTYTFDIPAQFRGYVTFTATNKAGNSSTANDSKVVVVDNIAPKVNVKFDNNSVADGKYYKADRTATITVDEANFWPQDIVVTVGKRLNNETEYKVTNSVREFTPVEGKPGVYTTQIVFNQDADYTLDISYKDRSGNAAVYTSNVGQDKETFEKLEFTVDKIAPKMSVAFDNNSFKNVNQFKANRTATITVVEHNFNPKDMVCAIVGKTVVGNGVDLTSKDYARYIRNIENWKSVGDKHTIDLDFDIDAQYDVVISYSDLADNAVEKNVVENFGVDKVAPSNLQIKYKEKSVLDVILEGITFGFYKAPVTVVLSAVDEISGVDFITYSYKVDDAVSKVNKGKTNIVVPAEDLVRTTYPAKAVAGKPQYERVSTEFQIPAQFRGYISFFATDKAGNKSDVKMDNKIIVVDDIAPVISVKYNKYTDNSHYTQRTGVITIKEANFWADDVKVTIKRRLDTESTFSVLDYTPVFTAVPNVADTYRAVIKYNELNENAEYIFDIDYTDKSGNKAVYFNDANKKVEDYTADVFVVDVTRPVISGSYNNNDVRNNDKFKANRTLTLTIVEHNFRSEDVEAVVTAKDKSGKEVKVSDYAAYLKKASSWTSDGDVHTAVIKFTEEANYTFGISYTDQAGNKNAAVNYGDSKAPSKFTIDKTKPTAAITVGNWDASKNGTKWDKFLSSVTFSLWGNKAVDVKATSADELSGIDTIEHFRSDEALTLAQVKANETWTKAEGTNFSYTVKPDERFIVYVHVVDKSGNEIYLSSDGIIIDKTLPDVETIAPEITVAPQEQPINGIYSKNVKVDVKVVDPVVSTVYSGLKSVTYEIFNNVESTTEPTQKGTLFTYDITAKKQSDLVQKYEKDACITINASKNNSNDVTIKITAVDNSDNVTVSTCDVKIDKTAPVIDIKYDNNKADSNSFFNANRTATIVVTERNFVAKDVVVKITNTDGKVPKLSSWKKVKGTGNLDDTKWTATINYVADGDYTFDIAYTDKAGLKCKSINYADGSVAPKAFIIDKTAPVVNVSYNNNTATNGNYFVAERVATVVINEHNFNPERVDFNITATDDAKPIALPRISGWVSKGDVRTCNIYYSADAKYDFDIDVTDKASNKSADYKADSFFVDKTDPQIEITNIQNHSANSGKVAPVIRFTDTNFDRNNVKVTLTGANRGTITPIGAYSDIHNGVIFSFSNFAEEKEIDDIYTVNVSITDKAGRSKTEAVTFSVNRFGSVYTLSKDLEMLVNKYSNEPKDIVLTETNPNQLSNISLTLFKNGETIVLKEGTDYRINVQGGNGNWYRYVYTIFEKNFKDDGVYSITVHSEDSAGNVAENTLDTKNIELSFGIDKTDPIINVKNLENNEEYVFEVWSVNVSANDNLKLKKVIVELDGEQYQEWSGKELKTILDKGEDLSFDIPERNETYDVKVIAIDEAGNKHEVEIKNVLVSTDAGARFLNALRNFYNNKPLFFGSIAGVVVVAGAIFFIVAKKKKKDEEKK